MLTGTTARKTKSIISACFYVLPIIYINTVSRVVQATIGNYVVLLTQFLCTTDGDRLMEQ